MIRGLEAFSSLSMSVLNGASVPGDLELFAQAPRGLLEVAVHLCYTCLTREEMSELPRSNRSFSIQLATPAQVVILITSFIQTNGDP